MAATTERIAIQVTDKVAASVSTKLRKIAEQAEKAFESINRVQAALAGVNVTGLARLQAAMDKGAGAVQRAALAEQKLAAARARTAAATARAEAAQARANVVTDRSAVSSSRLALANEKLATQQARTAAASTTALAAQEKAATAAARTVQAQERAAGAAATAQVAQQRLAQATLRTTEANAKASVAATNLATAQARLTAAQSRSAASGLGITTQQQKLAAAVQLSTAAHHKATAAAAASASAQTRAAAAVSASQNAQAIAANNLAASAVRLQTAQQRLVNTQNTVNRSGKTAAQTYFSTGAAAKAAGISQKQYENSLRGIPAQLSDIVVSLQGGQAPLTVLLQQGAQLKDMFNGVLPALRAVGGAILKLLLNPFVALTAAIVAVLVVFAKFESSARSLNGMMAQLAATGQNVSIDRTMLESLRRELTDLPDIGRKAADGILQEFVKMRNIGGSALQESIKIVGDLGVALGIDTPKAAEKLAGALNRPLEGAKELDKALGFLTVKDFQTISSLEKLGKTAAAQKIILDRLSVAVRGLQHEAMTPLQQSTHSMGQAWNRFKDALNDNGAMGRVQTALVSLVSALTFIIEKLTALANWKPPAWMDGYKPENWIGVGGMFGAGNTGGASGSWAKPTVPASARQPTEKKIKDAGLDGKAEKTAEKRAAAMAKINLELSNELKLLNMLGPAREAQERFDRYQEQLAGKGFKFTAQEEAAVKNKIANLQKEEAIQRNMIAIYDEATGPAKQWNDVQEAANRLLERGAITKDQHTTAMIRGNEAYQDSLDPMRQTKKAYQDELAMLSLTPKMREEAAMMISLENEAIAAGIPNREAYLKSMEKEVQLLVHKRQVASAYDEIYAQTRGAEEQLRIQIEATNRARQEGILTAEQYAIRMNQIAVQQANLNMTNGLGGFEDLAMASLGRVAEGYQGVLAGLSTSFGDFFVQMGDGFANSIGRAIVYSEDLDDALRSVAKSALSELISSLVKVGIQYAINAAIGNTVGAASTAASVAMAATTATAWAPAAAMVSLATMGANAVPAMYGMAATTAMSSLLAMASVPGMKEGGYTGDKGVNEVAGVYHGQEYVVNARATSRNRDLLEAINSGANISTMAAQATPRSGGGGGTNVYLNVVNNAAGTRSTQEQTQDENGDVNVTVTIDSIENALAGRMSSGKGKLHSSTSKAFGLTPRPAGG